ncbi:dipeptidase [Paenibacillus sp. NPDC056579]|uniref:dipeptidase n=1 Tax=unclassified Paenibacillus TaxID=185978 RepID=UPI001EF75C90|nr:dipeptidase [Paenibacillus sp. H1-7]ULL17260.1 membrane dipeptidase [Paenibacillus sp. H1-7]
MTIIDGHCDVLYKMYEKPAIDFYDPLNTELDVSFSKLVKSDVKIQFFAIYLSEKIRQPQFDHYLEYINIFYQNVVSSDRLMPIRSQADLQKVMAGSMRGAVLTLEGADAIRDNPLYTQTLFHLGVRLIGITWNYANWAADGVLEPRQGGFSKKGKRFIKECNDLGIILDVSHLSEQSFWDVADLSQKPFVATHSNAKAVCPHPRNLDDEQIKTLIQKKGAIGITFVPWFVNNNGAAAVEDLVRHIEHIGALGGGGNLVIGSDFDGIDQWIPHLENAGKFDYLAQCLSKYYKDQWIEDFFYRNWLRFLQTNLPAI